MRININKNLIAKLISAFLFVLVLLAIIVEAWCSDDAYHAFTMARNFNEGNGFTPTIGIRVNVSTCPLWTLIVAVVDRVVNNMYVTGILLNIVFSAAAVGFLLFYFCRSNVYMNIVATFALLSSKSFISFTTSGLENALLFLLVILFLFFFRKDNYSRKDLFFIALIEGFIAFARMDAALIFSFACIYAYLSNLKSFSDFLKRCAVAALGLSPFLLWELFSLIYYGSFFPNTMLAKLNTGYPLEQYVSRGLYYISESFFWDPIVLLIPLTFFILGLFEIKSISGILKKMKLVSLVVGLVVYFIYIVYIGGDFMLGRHFTVIFFASLILCTDLRFIDKRIIHYVFLGGIIISLPILSLVEKLDMSCPYVYVDERAIYERFTGLIFVIEDWMTDGDVQLIESCPHRGIQWYYGNESFIYKSGDTEYTVSSYEERLYDPLLVRLPAVKSDSWMVGHMQRKMPEGYEETLASGKNCIENDSLRQYYDILRIVCSNDIFEPERIKTMINLLGGKYEYLIEDYRINELGY